MSHPNLENFKAKEARRLDKRNYKFYASRAKHTHTQLISSGQNKTQVKKKNLSIKTQLILLDKNKIQATQKKKKKYQHPLLNWIFPSESRSSI